MVGLTRFLYLMNVCEKIAVSASVYRAFHLSKNGVKFHRTKKPFVLQALTLNFHQRGAGLEST
jgi:hypothetical protein